MRSLDSSERLALRKKVVRSRSGRGEDVKAPAPGWFGLGLIDEVRDGEAMEIRSDVVDEYWGG